MLKVSFFSCVLEKSEKKSRRHYVFNLEKLIIPIVNFTRVYIRVGVTYAQCVSIGRV